MYDSRDRELGMHRKITRRDFINGVAVTAGASMMPWHLFGEDTAGPEISASYYPPALPGMRGSHPGSFDAATAFATARSGIRRASLKIPAKPMT